MEPKVEELVQGGKMDNRDPMLANFIDLLAEILVASLNHPGDSEECVSVDLSDPAAPPEGNGESHRRAPDQSLVPKTTV
jgi:hypothetical protein